MNMFGISIFAWMTLGLFLGKIGLMVKTKFPSDLIGIGIIFILLITGALPTEEALSCFSSVSVVLVAVLFVLAAALIHAGVLGWITSHLFGEPKTLTTALVRTMLPAAGLSAFISAVPVVALLLGSIKVWAKKLKIAPSKLLIPLSYAASMGGICTLIGTTPNILISDFYTSATGQVLDFTCTTIPGLFCLVVGVVTILLLQRFIPIRKSPEESFESSTDYTVEMIVPADSPHIGCTVAEAHLDDVKGGHLVEIVRFDSEIISPVPKDEFILGNDHLVYSGQIDTILELRKTHALVNANKVVFSANDVNGKSRKLQMATVDFTSPLAGCKMKDLDFEDEHNVVLVAISREGERMEDIPREIEIHPGDTLLLEGDKLLPEKFNGSLSFFDSIALPQETSKTLISSLILIGMVVLAALRIMPMLNSCIIAVTCLMLIRCLSLQQLQNAINWKLLMVFAGSVALGKAMTYSGLSQFISDSVTNATGTNALLSLVILCVVATFITEFMSNVTAASILAPIALCTAQTLGANPMTFCVALMVSVSSSFATPIGSETNTFVYGPGGYKFTDYLFLGLPLNIVILVANIFITTLVFPL